MPETVSSLASRFQRLVDVMSSPGFLRMEGLGNEVPFFICQFRPSEAGELSRIVDSLEAQLRARGIKPLRIDLYQLAIEALRERSILGRLIETEAGLSKDQVKELLQSVLDPQTHLVPAIGARIRDEEPGIMLVTGVGPVYPYIRSHNVLNNLQDVAKGFPTVMFYPGEYTHSIEGGASLSLFGLLHDDKYYRAFNIDHYYQDTGA